MSQYCGKEPCVFDILSQHMNAKVVLVFVVVVNDFVYCHRCLDVHLVVDSFDMAPYIVVDVKIPLNFAAFIFDSRW